MKKKIRLGIFVIAGTFFFVTAMYYIGRKKNMFGDTFRISSVFNNVDGLQVGNNVRFSGINVGTVDEIEIINSSSVRVHFIIEKRLKKYIDKDAVASIGTDGLVGSKVVNIVSAPKNTGYLEDGAVIKSIRVPGTDDLLSNVKGAGKNAETITNDLTEIIGGVKNGKGTIGTLLSDSLFAAYFIQTVYNLNQSTAAIHQIINITKDSILRNLQVTTQNTAMISKELNQAVSMTKDSILNQLVYASTNAASITNHLNGILSNINQGQGTIGTLIRDTAFAKSFSHTIKSIESASKKFDENMEALRHSFLLRKHFPAPVGNKTELKESEGTTTSRR